MARAWGVLPDQLDQVDGRTYRQMIRVLADEAKARKAARNG